MRSRLRAPVVGAVLRETLVHAAVHPRGLLRRGGLAVRRGPAGGKVVRPDGAAQQGGGGRRRRGGRQRRQTLRDQAHDVVVVVAEPRQRGQAGTGETVPGVALPALGRGGGRGPRGRGGAARHVLRPDEPGQRQRTDGGARRGLHAVGPAPADDRGTAALEPALSVREQLVGEELRPARVAGQPGAGGVQTVVRRETGLEGAEPVAVAVGLLPPGHAVAGRVRVRGDRNHQDHVLLPGLRRHGREVRAPGVVDPGLLDAGVVATQVVQHSHGLGTVEAVRIDVIRGGLPRAGEGAVVAGGGQRRCSGGRCLQHAGRRRRGTRLHGPRLGGAGLGGALLEGAQVGGGARGGARRCRAHQCGADQNGDESRRGTQDEGRRGHGEMT